jgi:hypothetical protein
VCLGIAFLRNEGEVKHLIPTQFHNQNGIFLVPAVVDEADGHDSVVGGTPSLQLDVVACYLDEVQIGRASLQETVPNRALIAELGALALAVRLKHINVV